MAIYRGRVYDSLPDTTPDKGKPETSAHDEDKNRSEKIPLAYERG